MKISKSGLFLFELIIVIFLFTVSSAICVGIFAKSYDFSTQSKNLTESSLVASSVAEAFKSGDGSSGSDLETIIATLDIKEESYDKVLNDKSDDNRGFILNIYYDKYWELTDVANKIYTMSLETKRESTKGNTDTVQASIIITDSDSTIFEMKAYKNE